jgi:hypothetical protein
MDHGLTVVLAELLKQAREVSRIVRIFRLVVLLLLVLEKNECGQACRSRAGYVSPGVKSLSADNGAKALSRKEN